MTIERVIRTTTLLLVVAVGLGGAARAEDVADDDAMRAFESVVKAYRALPGLRVTATLKIGVAEGELRAAGEAVEAEFLYAKGGSGRVTIRDFTCYFHDDDYVVAHRRNDKEYFQDALAGSTPYWLLFDTFREMPYPHLAILWGEPATDEVVMQLQPSAPDLVASGVKTVQVDGVTRTQIDFSGLSGAMRIQIDPKTKLIQRIEYDVTGGAMVPDGAARQTVYTYTYETFDAPPPASEFSFDPGPRQRLDLVAALVPAAPPPGAAGGLVGRPAPAFVLATADGGAVDLEELRGKVVVLDFWATWCGPCRRALPILHDVADWARQEELPVSFLAINVWEIRDPGADTPDARREAASAFWRKNDYTIPVAMDYSDETASSYGVRGIPATFVIRSDGVVHAQPHADPEALKQAITSAMEALETPDAPNAEPTP